MGWQHSRPANTAVTLLRSAQRRPARVGWQHMTLLAMPSKKAHAAQRRPARVGWQHSRLSRAVHDDDVRSTKASPGGLATLGRAAAVRRGFALRSTKASPGGLATPSVNPLPRLASCAAQRRPARVGWQHAISVISPARFSPAQRRPARVGWQHRSISQREPPGLESLNEGQPGWVGNTCDRRVNAPRQVPRSTKASPGGLATLPHVNSRRIT